MFKVSNQLSYRPDIDGMRAIAVLIVLIYHAFPEFMPGGFIGVDVFFVISGFLITSVLLKEKQSTNKISLSQFYLRRVRRIFPALIIVLIAVSISGFILLYPKELSLLGRHIAASGLFFANFQFFSESGYFDKASELKPLLHLWSLGVEEQFYFFWPLLIILFTDQKKLFKTFLGFIIISFIINISNVKYKPEYAFFLPYSRVWELGSGGILAFFDLNFENKIIKIYSA